MPSIQVKHVPEEVHATLRRRAGAAGKSLQDFLLDLLSTEAELPTLDEVLDRAAQRSGGAAGFESASSAVRADRDGR